jgi:putative aminopeptidase FrvX
MDFGLLKTMCAIHAPSGNEVAMTKFILDYVNTHQRTWKVKPEIYFGDFQDAVVLVFGEPRTAVFAHTDNIGFTVRYNKGLVKIGGPRTEQGYILTGTDSQGDIECILEVAEDGGLSYNFHREIDRGTELCFKANFREDEEFVQCCYLDNRLGVYNALRLCETLESGVIAFTCWEEHGKGSTSVVARFLYEHYDIRQALISDITWITEGVLHGKGAAISIRDSGIPRRSYVNRLIEIARSSGIPFQLEVEGAGGSDGIELQHSPYPFDWCFVGAPEDFVHSPDEKVHKKDIESMLELYKVFMKEL